VAPPAGVVVGVCGQPHSRTPGRRRSTHPARSRTAVQPGRGRTDQRLRPGNVLRTDQRALRKLNALSGELVPLRTMVPALHDFRDWWHPRGISRRPEVHCRRLLRRIGRILLALRASGHFLACPVWAPRRSLQRSQKSLRLPWRPSGVGADWFLHSARRRRRHRLARLVCPPLVRHRAGPRRRSGRTQNVAECMEGPGNYLASGADVVSRLPLHQRRCLGDPGSGAVRLGQAAAYRDPDIVPAA
jgi:hypothetical protein